MHATVEIVVNVQVKRVPEGWHAILKSRAASRGISLNDLLLEVLERETAMPTLDEWNERSLAVARQVEASPELLAKIGEESFWDEVKGRESE